MKKAFQFIVGLGVCLLGAYFLRQFAQSPTTPTKDALALLESERKLAKQAGLPLTPADLPDSKTPPAQNLRTYLKEFSAKNQSVAPTEEEKKIVHQRLLSWDKITPQEAETAKRFFQQQKDLYALIEKGAACAAYSVPVKWSSTAYIDNATDFPMQAVLREQARWILARTSLFLAERRYAEAAKNAVMGLKLARLSEKENPTIIDLFISHNVLGVALKGVQKVLYEARDEPKIVEAMADALERTPPPSLFSRMVPKETLLQLNYLQSLKAAALKERNPLKTLEDDEKAKTNWTRYGYASNDKSAVERYCALNEAHLLQVMRVAYKSLASPYYEGEEEARRKRAEVEKMADSPDYAIATLSLTALQCGKKRAAAAALQSVTTIMARVMAWKAERKRYPDSLAEVYKSVPIDPFDGKPMRYRKEKNGFTVWSVGETLKYDGRATKQNESVLYFNPD